MEQKATKGDALPSGFLSVRAPRDGRVRWYAVRVPAGRESSFAEDCRRAIGPDLLEDCFVPRYERYTKRQGVWRVETVPMFSGYAFAATRDVRALARAFGRLSFAEQPVGRRGSSYAPLSRDVQAWLEAALDSSRVLRASEGRIEGGVLTVERGPLRGSERIVRKVDRHKRMAYVGLGDGDSEFLLRAGLSVPSKS